MENRNLINQKKGENMQVYIFNNRNDTHYYKWFDGGFNECKEWVLTNLEPIEWWVYNRPSTLYAVINRGL